MIRALIFDCFDVLYHGSFGHLRELTPSEDHQKLEDLRIAYDKGFLALPEYKMSISELIGKTLAEIDTMMEADHIRNKRLVDRIHTLKGDYKIAMLTNVGRGLLEQLFPLDEQAELFDAVVASHELGIIKPSPEIYTYTAAKLELAPEECLMIDDMERNITGAQAVGMQGIVYDTVEQLEHDLRERGLLRA